MNRYLTSVHVVAANYGEAETCARERVQIISIHRLGARDFIVDLAILHDEDVHQPADRSTPPVTDVQKPPGVDPPASGGSATFDETRERAAITREAPA